MADKIDLTKVPKLYKRNYITAAMLIIHEDCNLACTYCYEKANHGNRKMSVPTMKATLDFLFEEAIAKSKAEGGQASVSITFFGGEPMLNEDVIEFAFDYGVPKAEKLGIQFSAGMITNTTLLSDRMYNVISNWLDKSNFSVQMSVDGPKHVQDVYRVRKGGSSSWEAIEATIAKFQTLYSKVNGRGLNIHGVLGLKTLEHHFESFKYFKEVLKMNDIWFIPAHSEEWTMEHANIYKEQSELIAEYLIKEAEDTKSLTGIYGYAPLDKALSHKEVFAHKPCSAGDGYISVSYEGTIWPCHQFYFQNIPIQDPALVCGNVFEGPDEDKLRLFQQYKSEDMSCASGACSHGNCYRCVATNYEVNGSPFTQIRGVYCAMMKIDEKLQKDIRAKATEMGLYKSGNQGSMQLLDASNEILGLDEAGIKKAYVEAGLSSNNCACVQRGNIVDANLKKSLSKSSTKSEGSSCDGDCGCDGNCGDACQCKEPGITSNSPEGTLTVTKALFAEPNGYTISKDEMLSLKSIMKLIVLELTAKDLGDSLLVELAQNTLANLEAK